MFRDMRRKKQILSPEETEKIMQEGSFGVLACLGDEDYPYAVPLSYVYRAGVIYFHSAHDGHKIDALKHHPKVSFTVVEQDVIVAEQFTSLFRSAIAFGRARFITGEDALSALKALADKYSPGQPLAAFEREVAAGMPLIVAIDVEHLNGKEAIELVRARG